MLVLADIFLTVLHLLVIAFNMLGWIWEKTRKVHLIVLGLTIGSWFILGIWKGWGYCVLTDIHWRIKEKNGEMNLPGSIIKYHADKITGRDINATVVDTVTLLCLLFAACAAVYVNFIRKRKTISS